ncbi:MAG: hypothetical protein ACK53V_14145, partial [Planctomycetota bacterium]
PVFQPAPTGNFKIGQDFNPKRDSAARNQTSPSRFALRVSSGHFARRFPLLLLINYDETP